MVKRTFNSTILCAKAHIILLIAIFGISFGYHSFVFGLTVNTVEDRFVELVKADNSAELKNWLKESLFIPYERTLTLPKEQSTNRAKDRLVELMNWYTKDVEEKLQEVKTKKEMTPQMRDILEKHFTPDKKGAQFRLYPVLDLAYAWQRDHQSLDEEQMAILRECIDIIRPQNTQLSWYTLCGGASAVAGLWYGGNKLYSWTQVSRKAQALTDPFIAHIHSKDTKKLYTWFMQHKNIIAAKMKRLYHNGGFDTDCIKNIDACTDLFVRNKQTKPLEKFILKVAKKSGQTKAGEDIGHTYKLFMLIAAGHLLRAKGCSADELHRFMRVQLPLVLAAHKQVERINFVKQGAKICGGLATLCLGSYWINKLFTARSDIEINLQPSRPAQDFKKNDYYEVLGLKKEDRDVTAGQMKKAYNKKARECHPDKQHNNKSEQEKHDAVAMFKEIREAYEVLSNKRGQRAAYDAWLGLP